MPFHKHYSTPDHNRGWSTYHDQKARPVLINWVRYPSLNAAATANQTNHHAVKKMIQKGMDGCFELYGCACTIESLKAKGRCTCHDFRE